MKLLTIAIPTFERLEILKETLKNIGEQLTCEIEVVISDNGSKDGTREFLQTLDPNIYRTFFFDENQGIDANIVNVILQSQGEYIFLFSDDDLLTKGLIEELLLILRRDDDIICLNHFPFFDHTIKNRKKEFLPRKNKEYKIGESFFVDCGLGFLSSLVFKNAKARALIDKVRYGKESAHVDITSRIALAKDSRCFFAGELSVAGRSIPNPRYNMMNSCVKFLKELYDELKKEKLLSTKGHFLFYCRLVMKEIPRIYIKMLKINPKIAKEQLELIAVEFRENRLFFFLIKVLKKIPLESIFKSRI